MGMPMKSRILSIALALSMLAVVYVAVPMSAAVYYTGSVQTTDENGDAKTVFFVNPDAPQGDNIYVAVELMYDGELYNQSIMVVLYDQYGNDRDWFYADTGVASAGVYNSWEDAPINSLHVPASITDGQLMVVCDVVVYVDGGWWMEFARTQVIVKQEGLYLDPSSWMYYPGEEVTVTVITRATQDFYIEVVNGTDDAIETFLNIEPSEGYYSFVWVVTDAPAALYYMT